jgi:transcriptional regulator with XRE-family HTH domain
MTNEARVLKELREAAGLSMRKAGKLIGKSDSYISHLENGRMNIPSDDKLEQILQAYGGGIKPKSFRERARKLEFRICARQRLTEWIERASDKDISLLERFVFGVINN